MRAIQVQRLLIVRQQIPRVTWKVDVHPILRHHVLRRVEPRPAVQLVADAFHGLHFVIEIAAQQILHRVNALVQKHIINALFRQHLMRQRAHVRADDGDLVFRMRLLQTLRQRDGADHVGRSRVRILSVNGKAHEPWIGFINPLHRLLERQPFRAGVENRSLKSIAPARLRQQQCPRRWLDGGVDFGQFLVRLFRRIGRDEQDVERFGQRLNHL